MEPLRISGQVSLENGWRNVFLRWGAGHSRQRDEWASSTPLPLIPREQHVRKCKTRDRQRHRIPEQRRQPSLARCRAPHRNRHIRTDDQAAGLVRCVQAATHVVERAAVGRQRIGSFVEVFEGDVAGANRGQELAALPVDPGIANGAARVVPDNKAVPRHDFPQLSRVPGLQRTTSRCAAPGKRKSVIQERPELP